MGPSVKLGLVLLLCVFGQIECQKKNNGTRAKFSDLLEDMNKTKLSNDSIVLTPPSDVKEQNEDVKELEETVRSAQKDVKNEKKESKSATKSKPNYNDGIRMILGGSESRASSREDNSNGGETPSLFKRPSMRSLGFPTPMSFLQNFQDNVDWKKFAQTRSFEETNRVKRSTLDENQLRNAMIAAILQRQLIMAEDQRAFHHHQAAAAPSLPPPPPPHRVSQLRVPSPLGAPDAFGLIGHPAPPPLSHLDSHHSVHVSTPGGHSAVVHQEQHEILPVHPQPLEHPRLLPTINEVPHPTKGYAPPIKGGSLEDIFGVASKYYSPKPSYQTPEPAYQAPAPAYQPPAPAYNPPEPAYQPPTPAYHPPEPAYTPEPIYHPGPKYTPEPPSYAPEPKYSPPEPKYIAPEPAYNAPKPVGSYKPPSFHGHPFSMEMVFGLPMHNHYMTKYSHLLPEHMHLAPDRLYDTPAPAYKPGPTPVPAYHEPTPVYHEPSPVYHEPEPAYVAPKKVGYDLPSHGGSLEEIFGVSTKYGKPKYDPPKPDYAPPAPEYAPPPPAYQPNLLPAHNSYTLHYLPYEDYVPVHAEALAVKAKVPSIPGAAHFLVPSPHPHIGDFQHVTAAPHLRLSDPHHGIKKHRRKRSAQGF